MSMQEEKRSALASISALMPWWFLMTRSAEDTSLGVQRPHYRCPQPCLSPQPTALGGCRAPWPSPGPLLGIHLQVHPIHPQHQLPDGLEEAELVRGVQEQLAAGGRASLKLGPGLSHSLHVAADLLSLVSSIGLLEPMAIILHLLDLWAPPTPAQSEAELGDSNEQGSLRSWSLCSISHPFYQPEKQEAEQRVAAGKNEGWCPE